MKKVWHIVAPTALSIIGLTAGLIPANAQAGNVAEWIENITIAGDFRYRGEYFNVENRHDRFRNRLRLRLKFKAKVNDTVDVGVVLASGGEDPVSTNQSLDNQASTKDIRLDQAYFAWKPVKGLKIKGGKLKNPFYKPVKSELLWDSDIRPEGIVFQYDQNFFVNAGAFYVEERSQQNARGDNPDDSFLYAAQFGYKGNLANGTKFTVGTGYFDYTEIEGRSLNDFGYLRNEGSFGNTLDNQNNFVTDYNQLELFADVNFKLGLPISFFADYVVNLAAEDTVNDKVANKDTGYLVGFKIGKAKKVNSWDFRYNYRDIEADAVFAAFNDSDFIGGGTNGKGHELNFGYMISKGWKFAVAYFINEVTRLNQTTGLEEDFDYERIQVDLKFQF